jgi:hypothetical protein
VVQKLTLEPDRLGPQDIEAARAAGVSDRALVDALHICGLFNMIVRLADALEFRVPDPDVLDKQAGGLLKRGYRLPGLGIEPAPSAP